MNIKHLSLFSFCFSALFAISSSHSQSVSVVNDNFSTTAPSSDNNTTDAAYYGTSGSSAIEFNADSVGLRSGGSGRALHALFPTQTLENIGDTLTASVTFITPPTVNSGTAASNEEMRIGLFDNLGRTSSEEDTNGNPLGLGQNISNGSTNLNPLLMGLPGFAAELDIDGEELTNQDIQIRISAPTESGRLLGTSSGFDTDSSSSDNGYIIAPNTTYTLTMTLEHTTNDGLNINIDFLTEGQLTDSHDFEVTALTETGEPNPELTFSFGMLAMGVSAGPLGSNNDTFDPSSGQPDDNGLNILSFTVDSNIAGGNAPAPTDEEICYTISGTDGTSVVCL